MNAKFLEIRDSGTRIPIIAISTQSSNLNEYDFWKTTGFGGDSVIVVKLSDHLAEYDPYAWNNARTMRTAHEYIRKNYKKIDNFSVVDVRVILGEKELPAKSEIWGNEGFSMRNADVEQFEQKENDDE